MGWESSGVVGFDLGPLLQGQMRTAKLKSTYNSLIIGPRQTKTKYTCYIVTHLTITWKLFFICVFEMFRS